MAFCSKCGTEQTGGANFCVSCGTKMEKVKAAKAVAEQSEVASPDPQPIPPKNNKLRNLLIISGSAVAVIVLVVAVILSPKGLKLTKAEAEDRLADKADFSFSVEIPDEPTTIMEATAWVVFSAGTEDCSEDGDISSRIQDQGTLLASKDLTGENIYFNEDIIEFESDAIPTEIIQLVKDGYEDPGCDYDSDNISTTFENLSTSADKLGKATPNSAYFEENTDWSSTDFDYDFLDNKSSSVIVADGKYLIVIRLSVYEDQLSSSEMRDALNLALEKVYK